MIRVKDLQEFLNKCNPNDLIVVDHFGEVETEINIDDIEVIGFCEDCHHEVYMYKSIHEDTNVNLGHNGEITELSKNDYAGIVNLKVSF